MAAGASDTPGTPPRDEPRREPPPRPEPNRDGLIAQRAYANWVKAGKPRGVWETLWLEAEREVAEA